MDKTPLKQKLDFKVLIPPSPLMKSLGYGTGVQVYQLDRSPLINKSRSPWAIKKMLRTDNTVSKRLLLEAKVLKQLNHPNIVGFRAFTKDKDKKPCLVMEACTTSLGDLIESRLDDGLLAYEPKYINKMAYDVSKALDYLHNTANILHCDIKSYNVLVQGNFEICKLCDFGVSLPLDENGIVDKKYIKQNENYGTLSWMAPEAVKSNILTTKSDIYSFGLVVWEMLALSPPPAMRDDSLDDSNLDSDLNDTDLNDSDLNDSELSENDLPSREFGCRPELPPQELSDDYNLILELFSICTEQNPDLRPKTKDLVVITEKMFEEMKEN